MNAADVTVVVVNYRTSTVTVDLIRKMRAASPSSSVIVVDNSDDRAEWRLLEERLSPDRHVRCFCQASNIGFAAGVNAGLARATTEWALLLNPDLLDVPDVNRLISVVDADTAVVGPVVLDDSGLRPKGSYGGWPTRRTLLAYALPLIPPTAGVGLMAGRPARGGVSRVGWVSGACMLVRVADWRERLFDEALFMYGEDIDFCWAQGERGRRVLLHHEVVVRHRAGGSSGGRPPLLWATNLARVSAARFRPAPVLLALGLGMRAAASTIALRPRHGSFLIRSAAAALATSVRASERSR